MSKPRMYLTMIGGAGDEVTGSCTGIAIDYNNKWHYGIIDVGIVQGKNEYRNFSFPIDGEKLEFVIITHSHADHLLGIPLLRNYKGRIYGTSSAFNQGKELLDDSAYGYERKAAEELGITHDAYKDMCRELEALKRREHHEKLERYNALLAEIEYVHSVSLYNRNDVDNICKRFCSIPPYKDFMIADGIYARFIPNTHQNGAVSVELYVGNYGPDSINISFSGDLGPSESFLYKDHYYTPNHLINYCVMESLHGLEEREQTPEEAYEELKDIILKSIKKRKTVILAGFALDRSAIILHAINRMIDETNLSASIYFDSPLAYKELVHYQADYANPKNYWFKKLGKNPFDLSEVIVTNKYIDHVDALCDPHAKVVITASAFGEGGRILDYFKQYIQDENAVFVFVGWLSPDCTSNVLHTANRGDVVNIHNNKYAKYCETYQISGFTAHGYYPEFIKYIDRFPNVKGVILNHGEKEPKNALADNLRENYGITVYTPELYDEEQKSFLKITAEGVEELSTMEGYKVFGDIINF